MRDVRLSPVYYPHSHAYRYSILLMWMVNFFEQKLDKKLKDLPPKYPSDYLRAVEEAFIALPILTFSVKEATKFVELLAKYHDRCYFKAFKKAVGVDIKPLLNQRVFNIAIDKAIQTNVGLIRSIPGQLKAQLIQVIQKSASETGFNQASLSDFVNQEITEALKGRFLVAKTRAKLIARDQTNKTVAAMSETRNRQLGITDYIWIGVDDERERPSHVANNGLRFSYDTPPETGNPGEEINCRCAAAPIVEADALNRLAFNWDDVA